MLTAIVYSGDALALTALERCVRETGKMKVLGTCQSDTLLLHTVGEQRPDVVFLDIGILGDTGLAVAAALREYAPRTDMVMITDHREYAMDAFELDAVDCLLKPIQAERLMHTVERLRDRYLAQDTHATGFELQCMSEFAVLNTAGDFLRWPTQKAQEMLAFLWYNRKRAVGTSVLAETLWPDVDAVRARNNLYTTIYNMKKVLKQFTGNVICIEKCSGGYQFVSALESDAEYIQARLEKIGQGEFAEDLHSYKQMMVLYTGGLFEAEEYGWSQNMQAYLLELIQKHGLRLSNRLLKMERWREAQEILQHLLLRDPCCEGAHVLLIRVHARAADIARTRQSYACYCQMMRSEFDVEPRSLAEIVDEESVLRKP
ncbi:MAG: response regulator [Ethanoligenens sp.]